MHSAVLHFKSQALIVPVENIAELGKRLYLALAYTETLGTVTYDHYDVWGVRRVSR